METNKKKKTTKIYAETSFYNLLGYWYYGLSRMERSRSQQRISKIRRYARKGKKDI
jgi:hypothetical protein